MLCFRDSESRIPDRGRYTHLLYFHDTDRKFRNVLDKGRGAVGDWADLVRRGGLVPLFSSRKQTHVHDDDDDDEVLSKAFNFIPASERYVSIENIWCPPRLNCWPITIFHNNNNRCCYCFLMNILCR